MTAAKENEYAPKSRADDTKARRCETCEVAGCIDCVLAPAMLPDRGTIGSRWKARASKTTSAPVNESNETEAAPFSVEEMRGFVAMAHNQIRPYPADEARAIATAAALERVTNWILAEERDDGVKPIQALMTVGEALADPVERPAHYTQGDIECIDAIKAQLSQDEYRGFLRGQVAKYLWRMGLKGDSRTDAAKSHWYLSRLMRELGGGK